MTFSAEISLANAMEEMSAFFFSRGFLSSLCRVLVLKGIARVPVRAALKLWKCQGFFSCFFRGTYKRIGGVCENEVGDMEKLC